MDATTPLLTVANSHPARNPKHTAWRAAVYDLQYILKASPLNFLLVFVPLGLIWGHFQLSHTQMCIRDSYYTLTEYFRYDNDHYIRQMIGFYLLTISSIIIIF